MFEYGLDPKLKGRDDVTLLHLASHFNRVLMARMLLQAGADPTARNIYGKTPKDVAVDPAMALLLQVRKDSAHVALNALIVAVNKRKSIRFFSKYTHLHQSAITDGPPPPTPPHLYEIGEQAYCLDKHGHWWPAIIEQVMEGGL